MIDATRARGRTSGFTLIEILVALLIFALLAGFGYRGLGAVLDAGERVTAETSKWRDLALVFEHMRLAFAQAAERPIRDRNDAAAPAFVAVAATRNANEPSVWTRPSEKPCGALSPRTAAYTSTSDGAGSYRGRAKTTISAEGTSPRPSTRP